MSIAPFVIDRGVRLRRPVLVVALASLVAAPREPAHAGACPPPHLRVFPADPVIAPTNARVVVIFPAERVPVWDVADGTRGILGEGEAVAAEVVLVLRREPGGEVPVAVRRLPATTLPTFVLVPAAPLAPRTRYAVVVRTPGADYAVERFTTGDGPDPTPPELAAVRRATLFRIARVRHWKDPAGPYVRLLLDGDRDAEPAPLHLEIHALDEGTPPGDATLRAIVPDRGGHASFGATDPCSPADFAFPLPPPPPPTHRRRVPRTLRIGVRTLDTAGHASALREAVIDLSHPRTTDR